MTNLLILLTLPEPVRNQYRDRLKARFPQLTIDVVDHHSKVGPHIAGADLSTAYAARVAELFIVNLERYLRGQPLLNEITREEWREV